MTNHLILDVLNGKKTERTPVWMMRQAGRYLPDYMVLKNKYGFFERCQTPELVCEITLQPVAQIGVDAAIIFSDILVVPQAMGMEVQMIESKGPLLPDPIKNMSDLQRLTTPSVEDTLGYVAKALTLTKKELNGRVPLIGFAGAPWTLLCYMVEGKGSKTFDKAKAFCYTQPETAHKLLQMITDTTIAYLKMQVKAGADLVQLFDSWGGLLSPSDFEKFSLYYMRQIVAALKEDCPVILFAKGAWFALKDMSETGAKGIGIDWCVPPQYARQQVGQNCTLQGNFDPTWLFAPIPQIRSKVKHMVRYFGNDRYIANLGHGILPNTPVAHAKAFVEAVKEYAVSPILETV
jgi:uroporphyrinogen decarboxylase